MDNKLKDALALTIIIAFLFNLGLIATVQVFTAIIRYGWRKLRERNDV